ncbi:MAG: exopolysaccharide biosynthesis polyprenyl glycosylphosphotransferase [Patescibacteria group bacterium]
MIISGKRDSIILLFGDIAIFLISLWVMLFVRYLEVPSLALFETHLVPFSILFVVWVLVFFIAGLYGRHTSVFKKRLPNIITNAEIVNIVIAALFFFLIPYFGITPKTNLFIYLLISLALILWWRISGQDFVTTRHTERAILIGSGEEMQELKEEVNGNQKYGIKFESSIDTNSLESFDFKDDVLNKVYSEDISVIVIDLKSEKVEPILPYLYNLLFAKVKFIDLNKIYEDIFDRIPLSLLRHNWFLENVSLTPKVFYDSLKRLMDIVISLALSLIALLLFPFVYLSIKMDDGGGILIYQDRIGKYNKPIKIIKFRTMKIANDEGKWNNVKNEVTKVGKFLRKTRIDELPQLWNVLLGDLSLIGPRPELPEPAERYKNEIAYYNVRHLIKPGLSGWAQIHHDKHPHHSLDVEETKNKLSYDLFYVKNRSLSLDINIALKTIKTLLSRSGL